MMLLALAFTFALQAPLQQTAAPTVTETAPPVYGPTHFRFDSLRLSFDLPEGVKSRPDLAEKNNAKFLRKSSTGDRCETLEVLAYDPTVVRRVQLYHFNGDCIAGGATQETLRSLAATTLKSLLHVSGKESMTSPIDYEMGSHHAAVMSGNVYSEPNHGILFGEMGCALVESDVLCWAFISSTARKTQSLATMPVIFDGAQPTPIIPLDASQIVALPTLTFHDDKRHVEMVYPGTFASSQPRTDQMIEKKAEEAGGAMKDALQCMKVLLSTDELDEAYRSNIVIMVVPAECNKGVLKPSMLRDLANGVAKGIGKSVPSKMEKPTLYKIGDREDAVLLQGKLLPPGKPEMSLAESCTLLKQDFYCVQFTSTSADRLRELVASPVSFDGGLGVPLISPQLLKKP